jgi:DNA repair protein RecN (Recombination protein N)
MLEELSVRGYALIDSLNMNLTKGFNVLSGETGAGKSILIGALSLLLGEKGDIESIRTGTDEAEVTGMINMGGNKDALKWLEEKGIEPEEGVIILRRILKRSGRGPVFIQSASMTKQDLQELTSFLFDLHGQHEHQSLLSVENHRKTLDRFSGAEGLADSVHSLFTRLTEKRQQYEDLVSSERERLREADILQFAVTEIEKAGLKEGEEEELEQQIRILSDHEKLFTLIDEIYDATAENRGGSLAHLRKSMKALDEVARIDPKLKDLYTRLETAFYDVEDVSESIREYRDTIQFDPEKLESLEQRLALVHNLEKKYGDNIPEILGYLEKSKESLETMENWEEVKETLKAELKQLEKNLSSQATELSEKRKAGAKELEQRIEENLKRLGMPNAVFAIDLKKKENQQGKAVCGAYGFDRVEFLISPNQGEPQKPLKQIASGGEMSRIMLAIKSVLSELDIIDTLIFDEIDAGIGGEVALQVGEYLHRLAAHKQVLCITHLASIAVRADNHITVEKKTKDNRTVTELKSLEGQDRVREIARMLSGDTNRDASLSHAAEMLKEFHHLETR